MMKWTLKPLLKRIMMTCIPLVILFSISVLGVAYAEGSVQDSQLNFSSVLSIILDATILIFLKSMELNDILIRPNIIVGKEAIDALRPMWVVSRNVINVMSLGYVFYLSISNMIGGSFGKLSSTQDLRTQLPRVLFGVVFVNISLLIMQFLVEIVHVGYAAIVSVGAENFDSSNIKERLETYVDDKGQPCESTEDNKSTCKTTVEWINFAHCKAASNINGSAGTYDDKCLFKIDTTNLGANAEGNLPNIFMPFAIDVANIHTVHSIPNMITDLSQYGTSVLYNTVFTFLFMIANVAIFFALCARVVILWVAMACAPFIIMGAILGLLTRQNSIAELIITHLIMPLKIALAFTITFVMIKNMQGFTNIFSSSLFVEPMIGISGSQSFGFLWEMMSILVFWQVAKWAIDGNAASIITNHITNAVDSVGSSLVSKPIEAVKGGIVEGSGVNNAFKDGSQIMQQLKNVGSAVGEFGKDKLTTAFNKSEFKVDNAKIEALNSKQGVLDTYIKPAEEQFTRDRTLEKNISNMSNSDINKSNIIDNLKSSTYDGKENRGIYGLSGSHLTALSNELKQSKDDKIRAIGEWLGNPNNLSGGKDIDIQELTNKLQTVDKSISKEQVEAIYYGNKERMDRVNNAKEESKEGISSGIKSAINTIDSGIKANKTYTKEDMDVLTNAVESGMLKAQEKAEKLLPVLPKQDVIGLGKEYMGNLTQLEKQVSTIQIDNDMQTITKRNALLKRIEVEKYQTQQSIDNTPLPQIKPYPIELTTPKIDGTRNINTPKK